MGKDGSSVTDVKKLEGILTFLNKLVKQFVSLRDGVVMRAKTVTKSDIPASDKGVDDVFVEAVGLAVTKYSLFMAWKMVLDKIISSIEGTIDGITRWASILDEEWTS